MPVIASVSRCPPQLMPPEEEQIIAALRRDARLSLDDIVEVIRRCLAPERSRSSVWRCLKRLGLGGRLPPLGAVARPGRFDTAPFGYVHVDLKYLGKLRSVPEFALVAIERTTRVAHVEILPDRSAATVTAAMARFLNAFGHPVHTVLTDNGAEFTDRFKAGSKAGHAARPPGRHPFDQLLAARGIRHLTTRPYTPKTNGMVERFNRRLSDAMNALPPARDNARHRTRFTSQAERATFLLAFVANYNRTRLRCLNYKAPLEVLANQTEDNTWGGAGGGGKAKGPTVAGGPFIF